MSHSLGLSLASWKDKGYVDLPSQSIVSRPLHCGERHNLHELRKQIKNPQIVCRDDPREAQVAIIDLTQLERVHTKASSQIKRFRRSVSQRRIPRETEKLHSQ